MRIRAVVPLDQDADPDQDVMDGEDLARSTCDGQVWVGDARGSVAIAK
jgi:hypothetical protein